MIDVPWRRAIVSHSLGDRRESILPSQCACSNQRFSLSFFLLLTTRCDQKRRLDLKKKRKLNYLQALTVCLNILMGSILILYA